MRKCGICGERKSVDNFTYSKAKDRFHYACRSCVKIQNRKYYEENRDKVKKQSKAYREANLGYMNAYNSVYHKREKERYRSIVLDHYGAYCRCCGESNRMFLTIDHVNNDGNIERKKRPGGNTYKRIVVAGFPKTLQVLCYNCNCGKHRNGGTCPHKSSEGSETIPSGSTVKRPEARSLSKESEDIVRTTA